MFTVLVRINGIVFRREFALGSYSICTHVAGPVSSGVLKLQKSVFSLIILTNIVQIFQKRYFMFKQTKGCPNCRPSNFAPCGNRTRATRRPTIYFINSQRNAAHSERPK